MPMSMCWTFDLGFVNFVLLIIYDFTLTARRIKIDCMHLNLNVMCSK